MEVICRGRPGLRLSQKLLLALALLLVVVAALVGWSVVATRELSQEARGMARLAIPSIRFEVTLLAALPRLRQLESRYAVLHDPASRQLLVEHVTAMDEDLLRLDANISTAEEREVLREARAQLADFRALLGQRFVGSPEGGPVSRLETALHRLYDASEADLGRREAAAETLDARSRLVAVTGLAVCLLVALATALFAALRIGRPIRTLEAATREVADRAFSGPIPVRGQDEVAHLTRAFNQMAVSLRELDTAKSEFFAAISHDLRTPLAAIGWSAELLRDERTGSLSPRQVKLVEGIRLSTDRLLALVNQILDLGRLRAGKLRLSLGRVDLRQLIDVSVAEVRPLAEHGQVTLDVVVEPDLPSIAGDGERLGRVLVNLIDNAVRFTPPGGRISVRAERDGGDVILRVRDTGIGIPPDRVPRIFERYEQAHEGLGGSGIGLAVVKGVVEAHGGQVGVESEEGRGSCFTVRLPREAAVA